MDGWPLEDYTEISGSFCINFGSGITAGDHDVTGVACECKQIYALGWLLLLLLHLLFFLFFV